MEDQQQDIAFHQVIHLEPGDDLAVLQQDSEFYVSGKHGGFLVVGPFEDEVDAKIWKQRLERVLREKEVIRQRLRIVGGILPKKIRYRQPKMVVADMEVGDE